MPETADVDMASGMEKAGNLEAAASDKSEGAGNAGPSFNASIADNGVSEPVPEDEPPSLIEKYFGRRWSLAMATAILIVIMVYFNQKDVALLLAGGFVGALGSLFPQYNRESRKKE